MKIILYHGIDHDFFDQLREATSTIPQCHVFRHAPDIGTLIRHAFEIRPHIIIIDSAFSNYLAEEVRKLKTLKDFKSTLFVGYCKDDLEAKEGEKLFSAGAHLFHMKDTDFETFFRDCFQIAFEEKKANYDFARAKNLEIPVEFGFLSTLTSVTQEGFTIESDLDLTNEVSLKLPMASTDKELASKIAEKIPGNLTAPYLHSYLLKFPFPGPWDEVSENSVSPETVDTWIELRKKYFDSRKEIISIFTNDNEFTQKLLQGDAPCWYQIYRSLEEARTSLFYTRPGIVFYDLQSEEGADLNTLGELIGLMKEITPSPLVIVHGSKSDSGALRKLFSYEFLIGCPGRPQHALFQAMEKKYLEKSGNRNEEFFLKATDVDRIIEVKKTVILTSITERDLTFIIDAELPYFTVMKTELPLPFYLTIIPAEGQLPVSRKGAHYRALIHGLSEENLTKVRKVVNQLIYTPVKELSHTVVEIMLKQDYVQKVKPEEKTQSVPVETSKEAQDERYENKRNVRGKSKL